ncbi:MAG: type II toxin-antitoxin system RelE/ParE family toxin [Patescibacteria group bacterium]
MRSESDKRIIWSPESRVDVRDIGDYAAATYSKMRAVEFLVVIHDAAESLIALPLLWRVREDLGDIRLFPAPPYFICYRIQSGTIEIVRIIHQKRDIAALLSRLRV